MAQEEKNWERETLEKLAFSALKEQTKARRWGIFFKLLTFAYVTFLILLVFEWRGDGDLIADGKHTALVELEGVIDAKGDASAEKITGALQGAFKNKNTQGVILRINSPGGSPVQSGIINDEMRRLRGIYPNTPLYAVVEDISASGGYFVAVAADKIYVNKASLVGSIGVLMDGFGFTGGMEKLGVERRLLAAGDNKGFMDPFSPVDPKQKEYALRMLADIHQQFIAVVKQGRGKRLKEDPEVFSGLIWTGQKAVELGLADGYGSVESVARDVIKAESIVDYTEKSNPVERIAKRFGAAAARSFAEFTLRESIRLR
ncbi:MAG: peptidase S49 [Betaproteobacteria bacterium RIFCSPLOWO2_12_FULL_64_23]|nr:MAG: peptidase S49 [Betaproteobacteria bacterium RIFCSPLOWO2_12_FULL_64_23]